jgi:hypothetical protein
MEFHIKFYFLRNKQENVFENIFPAGARQQLRTATERRNVWLDAVISK